MPLTCVSKEVDHEPTDPKPSKLSKKPPLTGGRHEAVTRHTALQRWQQTDRSFHVSKPLPPDYVGSKSSLFNKLESLDDRLRITFTFIDPYEASGESLARNQDESEEVTDEEREDIADEDGQEKDDGEYEERNAISDEETHEERPAETGEEGPEDNNTVGDEKTDEESQLEADEKVGEERDEREDEDGVREGTKDGHDAKDEDRHPEED
ncbi:hypothetical protein MMC28_004601 [Mycoblastus sanguinarius]|nr:hypothetical protein [Mycoblastus sanguinarius]